MSRQTEGHRVVACCDYEQGRLFECMKHRQTWWECEGDCPDCIDEKMEDDLQSEETYYWE